MRRVLLLLCMSFWIVSAAWAQKPASTALLILCYHDVPKEVKLDKYGVDRASFVQQVEYLRTHGYRFVSLRDVIAARQGVKPLPEKAVLLTFDDAYASFYEFVYPLLKVYGYPSVLAVVTSWIDNPPEHLPNVLMTWDQIKEVAQSGLVDVASHSDNLHRSVVYNPSGNSHAAAVSRIYNSGTSAYETDEAFIRRIQDDLAHSRDALSTRAGVMPRALVWPYGQYNTLGWKVAQGQGFEAMFGLSDTIADIRDPLAMDRVMVVDNPSIQDFIAGLKRNFTLPDRQRVVQIDLDQIYDQDAAQQERNLDALIERLATLKPSTVYLQAFCDADGSGIIRSVYFPNRILPVKADLFNRVVNQLAIRGIKVYAWMPTLSIAFPDEEMTQALRVRTRDKKGTHLAQTPYERLSPFSPEVVRRIVMLYEDVAAQARIDGVVFLDDAYLDEAEDFHPDALAEYRQVKEEWMKRKTRAINELIDACIIGVRKYRPWAKTARTLYAPVLLKPESEAWFAQNYGESLNRYDYVVVMAYPEMEKVSRPIVWLKRLVQKASECQGGLAKTVFKIQAYDWERKRWIKEDVLHARLRALVAAGAQHVGYYPDDCFKDKPRQEVMRLMIGTEDFPFKRAEVSAEMDPYR